MKQVLVLRSDIGMSTGKLVAQACHAAVGAVKAADNELVHRWEADGATKIATTIAGEDALMDKFKDAQAQGLATYLVKDAGETELAPGTVTALGVGPGPAEQVDAVTKELELL